MADTPGIRGYLLGREDIRRGNADQFAQVQGVLQMQNALQDMQDRSVLRPLQQEQLRLAVQKAAAQQAALQDFANRRGGGVLTPAGALSAGAAQGDVGPTVTNAGRIGTQPGGVLSTGVGYQPEDLVTLQNAGVDTSPYAKIWELANPKLEHVPGVGMTSPRTGQVVASMPRITDTGRAAGLVPDGQGGWTVQVPQGSVEAYSRFQQADEAAKAAYTPFLGQLDAQNRPIPQTTLQFAQGGGSAPVPQAERTTASNEAEALRRVQDAEARGVPASVTVPGGPRQPGVGMGLTPWQRSAAETSGKEEAQLVSGYRQKIPTLNTTLRRLDMLERLNVDDRTYAAAGSEFKTMLGSIAQTFGLEIAKDKTANSELYLAQIGELMKDRLASKDYGSGTGVSNLDLLAARQPLPELAKTQQGRAEIIQAIRADTQGSIRDLTAATQHFDRNLSLSGFQYPSSTERERRDRDVSATVATERPRAQTVRPNISGFRVLGVEGR